MLTLTLQKATLQDVDIIWDIVQACSRSLVAKGFHNWTRYTKEKIENSFENSEVYILIENERAIGTVTVSENTPSYYTKEDMNHWADKTAPALYFTTLAIVPTEQGKGYGSKLIEFAEEACKKEHIPYLRMTSLYENTDLTNYYTKKGFGKVQTRLVEALNLTLNFYEKKI